MQLYETIAQSEEVLSMFTTTKTYSSRNSLGVLPNSFLNTA